MPSSTPRGRRTQAQRTAETRQALIEGTIEVIHRAGYAAASTELIAEQAGNTRGAILHHFGTRATLMAEVMRHVFEQEEAEYGRLARELRLGRRVADWVELAWRVLSKPSGYAVLEILLASRADPELAARVAPMQAAIEQTALKDLMGWFDEDEETALDRMRLLHWSIRGLSMARMLAARPEEIDRAVAMLRRWLQTAEEAGVPLGAPAR